MIPAEKPVPEPKSHEPLSRFHQLTPEQQLMTMPFNTEKAIEREKLLNENPELRIRIDTSQLRPIIDYIAFKCHPRSSIARDMAIKDSDIDSGLVILREEASMEQQLAFIEELRRQGFKASHPSEAEELRRQVDEAPKTISLETQAALISKAVGAEDEQIRFIPESILKAGSPMQDKMHLIYHAGHEIQ